MEVNRTSLWQWPLDRQTGPLLAASLKARNSLRDSNGRDDAPQWAIPRRDVLKGAAVTGGGIAAMVWGVGTGLAGSGQGVSRWFAAKLQEGSPVASPEAVDAYIPVALSDTEAATLRAVANRLIPATLSDPAPVMRVLSSISTGHWRARARPCSHSSGGDSAALDTAAGGAGFAAADAATQDQAADQRGKPENWQARRRDSSR